MGVDVDPTWARGLEEAGQAHLVGHAETLAPDARARFLRAAAEEPWDELREAFRAEGAGPPPVLRPPHVLTVRRQVSEGGIRPRLAALGEGLMAGGRVATLLLAGGQGTRLGLSGPKGNFVLGPEVDRTLYAIQVERVAAASRRAGRPLPLIVLVSEATEAATRDALAEGASRWGMAKDQIHVVRQRQLPALDAEGRALLAGPGRLATSPDGHGGALRALHAEGLLRALADDGVDVLTTYQVDNPLALPMDPVMLGWMVERRAQVVGKAVQRLPGEKVGVYARDIQGRHLVVEYSEFPDGGMPDDLKMGSIALHGFGVRWLVELLDSDYRLPYHRAWKKVPYLDAEGTLVQPDEPNAYKLELFVFDVIPEAERVEVHEVLREREFAPVKNAEGADSPVTARTLVEREVRQWYADAARPVPEPPSLRPLDM